MAERREDNLERNERRRIFASIIAFMLAGQLFLVVILTGVYFDRESTFEKAKAASEKAAEDRELAAGLVQSLQAGDLHSSGRPKTELLYRELKESDPTALDLKHLLFVTALELGESEFSEELRTTLAPEGGKLGYGPSHYFVGLKLAQKENLTADELNLMTLHFRLAAMSDIVPNEVRRWLGDCYYAKRNFGAAVIEYRSMNQLTPELRFKLALALINTDNRSLAQNEMNIALEAFRNRWQKNGNDIGSLVYLTKALFFVGRSSEAERILIDRLKKHDNVIVRNELIRSYFAMLRSIGNPIRQKELLRRICELDPQMTINRNTRQAHFQMGNFLVRENRLRDARSYYNVSAQGISVPSSIKNNLAWIELNILDGDLSLALKLSNEAINSGKNIAPEYVGTKGQILARLGRWEEARENLEKVVELVRQPKEVQIALSIVYMRLGNQESATRLFAEAKDAEERFEDYSKLYPQ